MNKADLKKGVQDIFEQCPGNVITAENAIAPYLVGLRLFDAPLVGIASAKDILFEECKNVGIIGPWAHGTEGVVDGRRFRRFYLFPLHRARSTA